MPFKNKVLAVIVVFVLGIVSVNGFKKPVVAEKLRKYIRDCKSYKTPNLINGCYRKEGARLIGQFGLTPIIGGLEQASVEESNGVIGKGSVSCHEEAHILGEEGAKKLGIAQAIKACTRSCGFGCFHGVFLGALKADPGLLNKLPSLCQLFADSSFPGQELTACQHGLGHGLADVAGRDLPAALSLCDRLLTEGAQGECASGVFMEILDTPSFGQKLMPLPDDIGKFCQTLPEIYANVCLRDSGGTVYRRTRDAESAFTTCLALEGVLASQCAFSLGALFHFVLEANPTTISSACSVGDNNQTSECIRGAVFSGFVTDPSGQLNVTFCKTVGTGFQSMCLIYLEESRDQLQNSK